MNLPNGKTLETDRKMYRFLMEKLEDGKSVRDHLENLVSFTKKLAEKNPDEETWYLGFRATVEKTKSSAVRSFLYDSPEGFEFFSKDRYFQESSYQIKNSLERMLRPGEKLLDDPDDKGWLGVSRKGKVARTVRIDQIREIISIMDRIFEAPEKPSAGGAEQFINKDLGRGIQQ